MPTDPAEAILEARFNADLADELLRRGMATEDQVRELGLPRHRELDEAEAEGRLEEAAGMSLMRMGMVEHAGALGRFLDRLHPRDRRGKFREKPGSGEKSGVPGAGVIKKVMEAPKPMGRRDRFPVFRTPGVRSDEVAAQANDGLPVGGRPVGMSRRQAKVERSRSPETGRRARGQVESPEDTEKRRAKDEAKRKKSMAVRVQRRTQRGARAQERMVKRAGQDAYDERYKELRGDGKSDKQAAKFAEFARAAAEKKAKDQDEGRNPLGRVSQQSLLEYVHDTLTVPSTTEAHSDLKDDGSRVWHEDRKQLHDAIIDVLLRKRNEDNTLSTDNGYYPSQATPEVLFMGGGYGAGKSSMRAKLLARGEAPDDAIVIDPDQIKAMLPEFVYTAGQDPEANLRVYEEAWHVSLELQRRAQARKMNVIVDGISNTGPQAVLERVEGFRERGYQKATVAYVDLPTEQALARVSSRALRAKQAGDVANMRHIPEPLMRAVHRDVAATIPALMSDPRTAKMGMEVKVLGNSGDGDPVEVASFSGGKLTVGNRDEWQRVLDKGHENIESIGEMEPVISAVIREKLADARAAGMNEPVRPNGRVSSEVFASLLGPDGLPIGPDGQPVIKDDGTPDWQFVGTHSLHGDGKGDFTEERVTSVHDPIIDRLLRDKSGNPIEPSLDEATGRPIMLFMGGATASGKSTALALPENSEVVPENPVFIDVDAIKELLPEYQQMMGRVDKEGTPVAPDKFAAVGTHQESRLIGRRLKKIAMQRGLNIVLDGTGNSRPGDFARAMSDAASDGYLVDAFYVNADTEVALVRAVERAEETGRLVPSRSIATSIAVCRRRSSLVTRVAERQWRTC